MPAAVPIPESRKKELEGFQRRKCSGHCLKRSLCVWLPHGQGMPAVETACSLRTMRGPKNPSLTAFEEESAFLGPFREAAEKGSALVAAVIKAAWEERLGRQPAPPPCTGC